VLKILFNQNWIYGVGVNVGVIVFVGEAVGDGVLVGIGVDV
jgi:hypothetical protein